MALSLKTAGVKLQRYAQGPHDPVHVVGHRFQTGRSYPSVEVLDAVRWQLEKHRRATKNASETRELSGLIGFLNKQITSSAEMRPSAKTRKPRQTRRKAKARK